MYLGDKDYFIPSWVESSCREVRLSTKIRKIELAGGRWGVVFFFSPNNGQSLECFFPKDHKNNTYFLKRQEIGDSYNHTGPKRGQ